MGTALRATQEDRTIQGVRTIRGVRIMHRRSLGRIPAFRREVDFKGGIPAIFDRNFGLLSNDENS